MKLSKLNINYLLLTVVSIFIIAAVTNPGVAGPKGGGFLGVYLADIDDELKEAIDYMGDGAYVENVADDSPAEKAGLEAGDVIIEFDGQKVKDSDQLRQIIGEAAPGGKVKIMVIRDGKKKTLKAELGERKEVDKKMIIMSSGGKKMKHMFRQDCDMIMSCDVNRGFLGVKLQDMSGQLEEYFGVKGGALIGEVVKDSPAEKAGLKAGDIIVEFSGRRVDDDKDLKYFIGKTEPEEEVEVVVNRKGKEQKFQVKLGKCTSECKKIKMHGFHDGDFDIDIDLENLEKHFKDLPVEIEQFELEDGGKEIRVKVKTEE